jgi:hypothetical protein
MRLVIVEWRDIIQTSGWESEEEVQCPVIRSVGWVIPQDDPNTIKICNTIAPENFDEKKDGKGYGITAFPKGCVEKIEYLTCEVTAVVD